MSIIRSFPVLALIAALAAPLAAGAQTAPAPTADSATAPSLDHATPGRHHHHHRSPFMHALRAVDLTPAQQQQIAAFHDAEKKANVNADETTRKANAAKLRDQIMGILTPDQKTRLSAELHRKHQMMTQGAGAPDSAATPRSN